MATTWITSSSGVTADGHPDAGKAIFTPINGHTNFLSRQLIGTLMVYRSTTARNSCWSAMARNQKTMLQKKRRPNRQLLKGIKAIGLEGREIAARSSTGQLTTDHCQLIHRRNLIMKRTARKSIITFGCLFLSRTHKPGMGSWNRRWGRRRWWWCARFCAGTPRFGS